MADHLSLDFHSLNHLHDLLLLLIGGAVLDADLLQTLIDIVVETLRHFFYLNVISFIYFLQVLAR